MTDTVVLNLPEGSFVVMDKDRFTPSVELLSEDPWKLLGNKAYMKFTCNARKEDHRTGKYYPRLTLVIRKAFPGIARTLRVEFSAPKLLYGNNFDELTDKDFDLVAVALQQRLRDMGVLVFKQNIEKAPVSAWHFSKNMTMQDFTTCSMVLNEISKANVFNRLDLNQRDYKNGGQAVKFHANAFEITFYDKLQDLANSRISEKRAIEKDNATQQTFFDKKTLSPNYQVLRMEARLNSKRKIKSVLKTVGLERQIVFKDLFSWQLAQAVLKHFWQPINGALRIHTLGKLSAVELFEAMQKANPYISQAKLQRLHSALFCIHTGSARRYRVALGYVGQRSSRWSGLMREINSLSLPDSHYQPSGRVRQGLESFKQNITITDKSQYNEKGGL